MNAMCKAINRMNKLWISFRKKNKKRKLNSVKIESTWMVKFVSKSNMMQLERLIFKAYCHVYAQKKDEFIDRTLNRY